LDPRTGDNLNRESQSRSHRHDPRTGLLTHQAFQDALAALLKSSPAEQEVALIWIDLVNLRREYTLLGWKAAEALTRRIAGTLRSVVDADTLLGRVGESSFLVAMAASKFSRIGRRRIQGIVDALTPQRQNGSETRLEVAAGVAFFPSDTRSAEDLTRFAILAADRASYVKSRNVIAFHTRMNRQIVRDHLLEVEMGKGLEQGQFRMFYQPKLNLSTGQVVAAEALMRWNHPELGAVTPSEFIPVAERSNLIHSIFDFNLRTVLGQTRRWRDLGLSLPIVAVNASAANVREDDFARTVRSIMEEIPIAPTQLELEITESLAFEDEELFRARIRQLKSIGVRVAIDDFGTRYTGFNVLKKLRLDTIKIDQCFISGVDRSQDMLALCRTIVAMGRQLNMRTVAEGIEELGELEVMRQIGCEAGQGYLFQRPIPADELTIFLREWPDRMHAFGFADSREMFELDQLDAVG
jgi:EAL domain-containing protein (putative c-di-GMP-specific phosphodiesterase class I)/GGDEF domain-containing protein